jgi:hypothetical protein
MDKSEKENIISNINSQIFSEDIESTIVSFYKLLDLLINLTEQLYKLQVGFEYWQEFLEEHIFAYTVICHSHIKLANGTPIPKKEISIIDLNSNYLLARAEIENYYTFYYLFIQPKTKEEYILKYLLFKASGLHARQKFSPKTKNGKKKQKLEKPQIEKLKEYIRENGYFKKLPTKKQKNLLKNLPAKTDSWVNLIKNADIDHKHFLDLWRLYSNYAHSESLSVLQFSDYMKNPDIKKSSNFHTLFKSTMLTAIYIKDFISLFDKLKEYYEKHIDEKTRFEIDYWYNYMKNYNP